MNPMWIGSHDLSQKVLIVAEIGNNHEGSATLASEMIERAAETGVDAVKFQTFDPAHYVSQLDHARLQRLRRFRLSGQDFRCLADVAAAHGVLFFSTPFDIQSVQLLDSFVPVFKIASGDNTFFPLLETVAETGKPIILSGGLATMAELQKAKSTIEGMWRMRGVEPGLAILHCVCSYPVPPQEANIGAIAALKELGCTIGYSDHTIGIEAAVLSVALGARIVEKHFTLDKNYSDFRDHQLSADPVEMRALVKAVRRAEILLGSGKKIPQPSELANLAAVRRSIVAARDLAAGMILRREDITWVRPSGGLAPGSEHIILGRRLSKNLPAGTPLTLDAVGPLGDDG